MFDTAPLSADTPLDPEAVKSRILIVDDEEINLKILRIYLEDKGYAVVAAQNGEEAINILKSEPISVCICDIRMPKISGIDVLNFVMQHFSIVPVIMLTGFIDINTAVSVMRKGASNYLTKPIDAGELIVSVEKALEHRKLVEEKQRLERENIDYQRDLERKIEEKTQALQRNMLDMVVTLSNTVEERDPNLLGHAKRVAQYATTLARQMRLDKDFLRGLHYAAILHDVGKIGISDNLLRNPGPYSPEDEEKMRTHVLRGVNILEPLAFFRGILPAIRGHHENWDGTGYPDGLAGEAIPLAARIIHVANAFDTLLIGHGLTSTPDTEEALSKLNEEKGQSLDPQLTELFSSLVRKSLDSKTQR